MRIIIAWGEDEKLLNKILPREYFTSNAKMRKKRMNWVIDKIKNPGGVV